MKIRQKEKGRGGNFTKYLYFEELGSKEHVQGRRKVGGGRIEELCRI
jgi:hypothetical protein